MKFEFKKPRLNNGDLRTPIVFFEYAPNEGPEPGESVKRVVYRCLAKVDQVWMKDLETAKANGTLSDATVTIRDPLSTFQPTNKHYLEIDHPHFYGRHYNIKHVQPDMQSLDFIKIVAELKS